MSVMLMPNRAVIDALVKAGLIDDPNSVRRVVIDLEVSEPARVYVERYVDGDLQGVIEAVGIVVKQVDA